MMYAREAKKITREVALKRNEVRRQEAKHIIETQIAKAILEACNNAKEFTSVYIDASVNKNIVMKLLSDYGYNVKNSGNVILIDWF